MRTPHWCSADVRFFQWCLCVRPSALWDSWYERGDSFFLPITNVLKKALTYLSHRSESVPKFSRSTLRLWPCTLVWCLIFAPANSGLRSGFKCVFETLRQALLWMSSVCGLIWILSDMQCLKDRFIVGIGWYLYKTTFQHYFPNNLWFCFKKKIQTL